MAFAGMGDALLYPLLPVYGKDMGFSVFFIGVLLSVNRFIRILANTPIANLVNRLGMKKVLIVSSILAVITTVFYGLKLGLISFLIARIIWGLSYSGLKIATLNYAAKSEKKSGLAFGFSKSIKTLGAFFILWFGPVVIDAYGIENGLLIVGLISLTGVILALSLPTYNRKQNDKVRARKTFQPTPINLLVFALSITIDGILVVVLSNLLITEYSNPSRLLVVVAFYLLLKRLFVLVLSFVSAFVTLRVQVTKLFNVAILICILATLLISFNLILPGIILAFLFNPIIVTFSPLVAIEKQKEKGDNSLQAISSVSTWWDLGAAVGAFLGIFLVEKIGYEHLFLTLSVIVVILFFNYFYSNAKLNRTTIQPSFSLRKEKNKQPGRR
ncbi:MAG: MFS transporter [Bacteroidota bacterium]